MGNDLGYNNNFLGTNVKMPKLGKELNSNVLLLNDGKKKELKYKHFSLMMHKERRLALLTGVNIDGTNYNKILRDEDKWKFDNRIEKEFQIGAEFYGHDNNRFDLGHLVRRMDPDWGDKNVALQADKDTFHYTNCAPQHQELNRKIWQELEKHVLELGAIEGNKRISVFTGPILNKSDKYFPHLIKGRAIQIPTLFWKVIVWQKKKDKKLYAVGFIQSQWCFIKDFVVDKINIPKIQLVAKDLPGDDDFFEHLKFKDDKTYQVEIKEIEKQTGLKFDWPDVHFSFINNSKNQNKSKTARSSLRLLKTGSKDQVLKDPLRITKLKNIVL